MNVDRLHDVLHYDPLTGVFRWRVARGSRAAGDVAGGISGAGYRQIGIDGRYYQASRLAWLYTTGEWPDGEIDHKNGVHDDNRWDNLRDVTHTENNQNQRRAPRLRGPARMELVAYAGSLRHASLTRRQPALQADGRRAPLPHRCSDLPVDRILDLPGRKHPGHVRHH